MPTKHRMLAFTLSKLQMDSILQKSTYALEPQPGKEAIPHTLMGLAFVFRDEPDSELNSAIEILRIYGDLEGNSCSVRSLHATSEERAFLPGIVPAKFHIGPNADDTEVPSNPSGEPLYFKLQNFPLNNQAECPNFVFFDYPTLKLATKYSERFVISGAEFNTKKLKSELDKDHSGDSGFTLKIEFNLSRNSYQPAIPMDEPLLPMYAFFGKKTREAPEDYVASYLIGLPCVDKWYDSQKGCPVKTGS